MNYIKKPFYAFDRLLYRISCLFFATEEKRRSGHQFLTFGVIGVGNTIIDFGIYTWLTRDTGFFNYASHSPVIYLANAISFTVATTFSFFCNRSWTFRRKGRPNTGEVVRFYTTTLSGLVVNTGILFALTSFFGVNDLVSKACGTLFSMLWNFFLKKFWVFSKEGSGTGGSGMLRPAHAPYLIGAPDSDLEVEFEEEEEARDRRKASLRFRREIR